MCRQQCLIKARFVPIIAGPSPNCRAACLDIIAPNTAPIPPNPKIGPSAAGAIARLPVAYSTFTTSMMLLKNKRLLALISLARGLLHNTRRCIE
jgi:hypothetical protein